MTHVSRESGEQSAGTVSADKEMRQRLKRLTPVAYTGPRRQFLAAHVATNV